MFTSRVCPADFRLLLQLVIQAKPSEVAGRRMETANSKRGEKLRRPPRVGDVVGYRRDQPELTEETIQRTRCYLLHAVGVHRCTADR